MKLGVCYYPEQWDRSLWRSDARRMAELGLRVVRIAEFAWALMEPREAQFEWQWLDEAVDTLAEAGLQVILGTPTAAPPRWLTDTYPEVLPVDAQGRTKLAGSRRHVCFSSPAYFEASRRIVTAMAQRYGQHPAVVAWQVDNEYGCNDTVLSYSPQALRRFRLWLAERYGTVDELNRRWGNVFWSMQVDRFEQVGLPVGLAAQVNPLHALDWRRFAADEVLRFHRMQVDLLRRHAPGRDVTHNFMGFFGEFDHHAMAPTLDFASWDSYPLGFTDSMPFVAPEDRLRWARSGHPDMAAFHHDLYRQVGNGRFAVMEQQAGPVNWAPWNALPQPGQVRAWTWEAFAHGAELVSYFRWRQLPCAQEHLHSGLNGPDNRLDRGGEEVAQVAGERAAVLPWLADAPAARPAAVALVLDYASHWMQQIQPHGADAHYFGEALAWYAAARRLGLDVDIVGPQADLQGRALVLLPGAVAADAGLAARLQASGAQLLVGARSGSRDGDFRLPEGLPPGPLGGLAGVRVRAVESLRPGLAVPLQGAGLDSAALRWRERLEVADNVDVLARFTDAEGGPALTRLGRTRYLACGLDTEALTQVVQAAATAAGLATQRLPEGLRLRRRGALHFAFHSGPGEVDLPAPADARFVLGSRRLGPAGVAAWVLG